MNNFEYWTVDQIVECNRYPFSMGQIRLFLFHRKENGLQKAIRKVGKRLLVRIDLFEEWIENNLEQTNSST